MPWTSALGGLLLLAAILVPSSTLLHLVRGSVPAELAEPLLAGAALFRLGLAGLGLAIAAFGKFLRFEPVPPAARPPAGRRAVAALAAILLVATALRLYQLESGLWLDEILTHVLYVRDPAGQIITTYEFENQHFLYSLLAHASYRTFGEHAWSLRLPAALFGVGSILALYLLGREVGGDLQALFAAGLITVSYHHVWFSQNARGYSGLLFWTLLASWLLLRGLREFRPRTWLWYAGAVALGTYTQLTMLFVVAGHFIIYALALLARRPRPWPNRWAGLWLGFVLGGLLTFQLHALVLPQMLAGLPQVQSVVEAWKNPLWTLLEFARGVQLGFATGLAGVAALIVFGAGLASFARSHPALLGFLFLPAVLLTLAIVARGHHLWPRFYFFAIGFGALAVVRGALVLGGVAARALRQSWLSPSVAGPALCAAILLVSATTLPKVYGPKQDYAGALAFVQASRRPNDAVVTVSLAAFPYQDYYHADWQVITSAERLDAVRAGAPRTWLIYTFPPVLESVYPEVSARVARDFGLVRAFGGTVSGGTIFVVRSDS